MTAKTAQLTEIHINYLRYLAGMTNEYPLTGSDYHVARKLYRLGLLTEPMPNRNGTYNQFPTAAAMPLLGI